ncbi:MAG: hypothetical protein R2769_14200 [Saprospiraceae bacterium]
MFLLIVGREVIFSEEIFTADPVLPSVKRESRLPITITSSRLTEEVTQGEIENGRVT